LRRTGDFGPARGCDLRQHRRRRYRRHLHQDRRMANRAHWNRTHLRLVTGACLLEFEMTHGERDICVPPGLHLAARWWPWSTPHTSPTFLRLPQRTFSHQAGDVGDALGLRLTHGPAPGPTPAASTQP
jgi:hypothetical protein